MVFVYVLRSLVNSGYYIGISKDLQARLVKHNSGGVYSTKKKRPWTLLHFEEYSSYQEARAREKEIKSWKGGNTSKKLLESV